MWLFSSRIHEIAILAQKVLSISAIKVSSVWPIQLWRIAASSPWWKSASQSGILMLWAPKSSSMFLLLIHKSLWRRLRSGMYYLSRHLISFIISVTTATTTTTAATSCSLCMSLTTVITMVSYSRFTVSNSLLSLLSSFTGITLVYLLGPFYQISHH